MFQDHVGMVFQAYMDAVMKKVKNGNGEEGKERRLPSLLYADNLVIYGV